MNTQQKNLPAKNQAPADAMQHLAQMANNAAIKSRFEAVMKDRAPSFMASVLNAVRTNPYLAQCDHMSLWSSALVAATLNLPIDGNLGFAALVPYKGKVQFQIMYRGYIQLAIRSGQYADMDVVEIYKDELKSYNPITRELEFTPHDTWKMRESENQNDIVGYYASFRLVSGFTKWLFMTRQAVEKHAKRFSETYNRGQGQWVRDFNSMALKTVLKRLISKWGILSIEMQRALTSDHASFIDVDSIDSPQYDDNGNEITQEINASTQHAIEPPADQPKADPIPEVFK